MSDHPPIVLRPCADAAEFPSLVAVWRSAVEATHDFLTSADIDAIERRLAPEFFPMVELTVAELEGRVAGFSGLSAGKLEMLFVADPYRGRGVGAALVRAALRRYPTLTVDVNEQNPQAVGFYERLGFVKTGRSETDSDGRPFPLLHFVHAPIEA
ncbi:acetyltransferase [Nocardia sp. NPDC050406]|uniref:acetyltransferase n=1 Tax=Nocardia sp. NPDC050406 TaxID=3364318 RepID=UPI003791553C